MAIPNCLHLSLINLVTTLLESSKTQVWRRHETRTVESKLNTLETRTVESKLYRLETKLDERVSGMRCSDLVENSSKNGFKKKVQTSWLSKTREVLGYLGVQKILGVEI
ncbi:hypothetical protein TNCT_513291 [Trichonephila clavata]|uniref:Uncharacterized protein n=1 Tax=Trichonephila clavata TaxID=2740835 RepID=A0A8X6GBZ1_TRICU|nr:hypothetical protein TNCT_513291 [Trichonephila clavata]